MAMALASAAVPLARAGDDTSSAEPDGRVSVHGHLSQAYGASDGHQLLGIGEAGTSDYRTAALQLRYSPTPKDALVFQVAHERLGQSPLMGSRPELELDWAFFEHRFSPSFSIRAGKVQIPFGVFNEVRDVGTLLPFFRPPEDFYGDGSFTSETLAGVLLSKSFGAGSSWPIDVDAYYGEWSYLQQDNETRARIKNGLGAEVWLQTPLTGLRVGAGGYRGTASGLLDRPADHRETRTNWHVAVDGSFSRIRATVEYTRTSFDVGRYDAAYALVSVRLDRKLAAQLQAARGSLELDLPFARVDRPLGEDIAVGLTYAFRPELVVKAEHHWNEGVQVEDVTVDLFNGSAVKTRYFIVSVAVSF